MPAQIRDKIIKGEFIDINSLLETGQVVSEQQKMSLVNGELVFQQVRKQKINNIETWTDAFINFIGIYCSVHTDHFNELLKYMYTIRLGSKSISGSGWIQYDEQYRLRKAMNPSSSWSIMDSELWLLYMNNNHGPVNVVGNVVSGVKGSASGTSQTCYPFNYIGHCPKQFCIYNHLCLRCEGFRSLIYCPQVSTGRTVNVQRSRFHNTHNIR